MKRSTLVKHHRYFGIVLCLFVLPFSVSGIILNHRLAVADIDISRKWLPSPMRYHKWNNGLVRGTISGISGYPLLFFGNNGVWATDSAFSTVKDFNAGFPKGVDNRNVRALVRHNDTLFAATQSGLFRHTGKEWQRANLPSRQRLSDLYSSADTLVVLGRSTLFVQVGNGDFKEIKLASAEGESARQSLFRVVLGIHSGSILGISGIIIMDVIGVIFSALAISGIVFTLARKRKKPKTLKMSLKWHKCTGIYTVIILFFVTLTGWLLRPPGLIALVKAELPISEDKAWEDKLRAIRYDSELGRWMLSTSDGFYTMASLTDKPKKMEGMPPVSVMGINVWERVDSTSWLIGSLSGLHIWDSATGRSTDYFTGEPSPLKAGPPFGANPIIGYALGNPIAYYDGSDFAPMPSCFAHAPMSLWNLALEVHTGRIYTILGPLNLLFIFFAGGAIFYLILTGYSLAKKPRH